MIKHLLIVDDEASVREVLKSYLVKQGYQVSTVASGAEALKALHHSVFDLIVLDVLLEDTDGLELIPKLRNLSPDRPVVVISGFGTDEDLMHKSVELGASEFVSKTAPLNELRLSIERALAKARASSDMPRMEPPRHPRKSGLSRSAPALKFNAPSVTPAPVRPAKTALAASQKEKLPSADSPAATAPEAAARNSGTKAGETAPSLGKDDLALAHENGPTRPVENAISAQPEIVAPLTGVTPEGNSFNLAVEVFLKMLSAYHPNLGNAAMRAVVLCKTLGENLELPSDQRQNLLWAAALHDVGLVQTDRGLYNRWLRHPENCSKPELAQIRRHPALSLEMLESYPSLKGAGEIIRAHHEHWDGTGFPAGLQMETIPWLARLLSCVIFYCSRHQPSERTLHEMEAQANRHFDPQAVRAVAQAAALAPLPRGQRELPTSELRPGMVLASNIVDSQGVLIIGKGSELTNAILNRVVRLIEAAEIESRILVCC